MSCFPCFSSKKSNSKKEELPVAQVREFTPTPTPTPTPLPENNKDTPSANEAANNRNDEASNTSETGTSSAAKTFTFRELASATRNFRQECLLGESGLGKVYKGTLHSSGEVVAVKQLDRNGTQGNKEFLVEVMMLSLLHHPNLVNLIGYCADGDQRLLVYEYMPSGSLDDHLFDISNDKKPLDWTMRMKIASGAAQGVEYLHEKANPPIIFRDLKSSNILLDLNFNPRLTDYGLAKLGLANMQVSQRVMGKYFAPEYERTGELTLKSDVYSFGVVLLELITGRRALDTTRPTDDQNLVSWAQPYFRDPRRFPEMADPLLKGEFPVKSLNQAVGVAAMCLQEEASVRPLIGDVVAALSFLSLVPPDESPPPALAPPTAPSEVEVSNHDENVYGEEADQYHDEDGDISNHQNKDNNSCNSNDEDEHRSSSTESHHSKKQVRYHEDGAGSSSESLYNEDEDSADEHDLVKRSRKWGGLRSSRSRSTRDINVESEEISVSRSRRSSRRNRNSSRRIKCVESEDASVGGKSSRQNSSSFGVGAQQQRVYSNSNSRRKSNEKSQVESSNSSSSSSSSSINNVGSISRESSVAESSDESAGSISRHGSHSRSISSNSKFSLDSRCYSSNMELHCNDGSNHGMELQ